MINSLSCSKLSLAMDFNNYFTSMKSTLLLVFIAGYQLMLFGQVSVSHPVRYDKSPEFIGMQSYESLYQNAIGSDTKAITNGKSASVEQTQMGTQPAPLLLVSFDGLGEGFEGPQGTSLFRNPSDNSLAVGPDHIVQTVNSRMAIFTKKGSKYDSTGEILYGPVETNNIFRGFGGPCEKINNGDAVIRYDQLADRWLLVMPLFRRAEPGINGHTGPAELLYQPPALSPEEAAARNDSLRQSYRGQRPAEGQYGMCYAVSTRPDPMGSWYRYEYTRDLFPDYPRPAVWPDGYYTPTSTGDNVIQKHVAVVDRNKMLKGEDATEQIIIIDSVNFLNTSDLVGKQLPPEGAPNIIMATGGSQLNGIISDNGIYVWKYHVDWKDPSKSNLEGPVKIDVAPYEYLGGGQLTEAVPQAGVERRLDAQGDKIMANLLYRRIGDQQSLVAVHSVATKAGGGGVRWYEFRLDQKGEVELYQQRTYAPDINFRWMASPAMDALGNIGIGYSFGGAEHFPGQRFAGRLAGDMRGLLTMKEVVLVEGQSAQTNTNRWEDYTQTAMDPDDDLTIWYVGDYLKDGAKGYSTRIGAFRLQSREK